ncbi:alanine racemase [Phreatobacter stygius]|uniref:Alanine racemase n=2 Tax=Phreatobacter stygius TaxID=1940610 RepID=A0A4D7B8G3_9HYPH|nr:alanine racemase [Phreatobacter stygius]QCI69494.1 alanine racemase [Phreatobacter stygius]
MSDVPADEAGARLTVDLGALKRNYQALAAMTAGAECAAVVKADAYGIGIEAAGPALAAAGARTFFVAHLSEARRLRAVLPSAAIYVLNGLFGEALATYADHQLRPVLGSRDDIERFSAFCSQTARRWPAAIHVDTGMNRLGLDLAEAALLAEPGPHALAFEPALLMSHFACADEPGHPLTARQVDRFAQVRGLFPGVPGSLANSAGCTMSAARHDLARPGVALYGARYRADRAPLEPVVRLDAPLVQVREVRAGDTVGYGATWSASRPSRIGIVSVGYADGYLRSAGTTNHQAGAYARVNGVTCRLAGRVSMDLIAIDVTDAGQAAPGDTVTLIGDGIGVDDVAEAAGTIGYEVLTSLGRRYNRRYTGG